MNAPEFVPTVFKLTRREFLGTAAAFGGLMLGAGWAPAISAQDAPKYGADSMPNGAVDNPLVFVAIADDGIVSITCHRAEMGQGVRTGVPMIVADEMEADWSKVRVVQATGDEVRYGNQDTDGSRTTRHFFMPMRRCGATARKMLETAAAARWNVPVAEVDARNSVLVHRPTGRKLSFGEVARDAAKLPLPKPDQVKLKDPSEFRYIGKGKITIVDGFDMTTGRAKYGLDIVLPGHAVRGGGTPAGARRHRRVVRCRRGAEGAGRGESGRDQELTRAGRVPAVGRRGGDREQHLGGDPGPQGAQDQLERRPERVVFIGPVSRAAWKRRRASPGKVIRIERRRRCCTEGRRQGSSRRSTTSRI